MRGSVELRIAGETLLLHPERAVLWPERNTVIVADTHFGKSGIFRRHGVAVPAGSDEHDRRRLGALVRAVAARRLIILGDFLHAPLAPDSRDADELAAWCAELGSTEIHVIAGNHDRGATRSLPAAVRWQEGELRESPFRFTHDAGATRSSALPFTLSGHVHPVVRLGGLRKRAARVPIFWQRETGLVLPSFGIFTGGYVVTPSGADRVFAAGPQGVVAFR